MRIVSLNAWGGRLHEPLITYLAEADPDILCLQEVTQTCDPPSSWLSYRDGDFEMPQRADLFADVKAALPGHRGYFCPAARGFLYDGERGFASEWGLATFVRETIPVIGQAQDFVHGDFSPDGWGEHPRARNAHVLRLFDGERASSIVVAHMHGLRDLSGKQDTPAREAQARVLVDLIGSLRRPDDRLVVCGDFNVLPGSLTFDALAGIGLADLVTGRGHSDTRTSHYTKAGRFADYMFVSGDVEVRHFEVVADPEVSDHRPLLLDVG